MYVERLGDDGPAVLLVHGSFLPGWLTWAAQRPLAERYRLVVPHRTGYPPNPPLERIDFEVQARELAELIEPGTHLVGHSYGGVVSLLAAALVPDRVASLTVIEPPAFGLVRGDPDVESRIATVESITADRDAALRDRVVRFAAAVGAVPMIPDPLPPPIEAAARAVFAERGPWEAEIPLATLAEAPFPKLVVSGGHDPAFDAVCDAVATGVGAERAVIRGAGHSVARTGEPFNRKLTSFIDAA